MRPCAGRLLSRPPDDHCFGRARRRHVTRCTTPVTRPRKTPSVSSVGSAAASACSLFFDPLPSGLSPRSVRGVPYPHFKMIVWEVLGDVGLVILLAVHALAPVIRELLSSAPRICTRCAARTNARQGWRVVLVLVCVFALALALSASARDYSTKALFALGLGYLIDLLGVGLPVCETCRGRTLVPTSSPIGKEILRDYHHSQSEDPSSSTPMRSH
jgi:hypothetical protein